MPPSEATHTSHARPHRDHIANDVAIVEDAVREHVAGHSRVLRAVDPDLTPVTELLGEMARGGKRIRAAFCMIGARGASGGELPPGSGEAAAAIELFHLAALIHDDVMDHSDRRRGRPTAHRHFAGHHRGRRWAGDADAYGEAVAVLAGDLCLTWSDDLIDLAVADRDLPTRRAGRAMWSQMRDETIAGQYLDILGQAQRTLSSRRAGQVMRFKSARYTIGHPLRLGGVLGGASEELLRGYDRIGLSAGEAFQLRDDVLGVFGDPDLTDDGLLAVCAVLRDTGAADDVEQRIAHLTAEALDVVDGLGADHETTAGLRDLVERCAWRRR